MQQHQPDLEVQGSQGEWGLRLGASPLGNGIIRSLHGGKPGRGEAESARTGLAAATAGTFVVLGAASTAGPAWLNKPVGIASIGGRANLASARTNSQ